MKYVAAGVRRLTVVPIAVLSLLVLPLNFINAATAQPDRASDDKAAIRATITDYIEGYYLNDAARMERSLHPHYLKHTINGSNGELKITDKTGMEMVQEVRNKEKVTPVSERKEEITILDIDGDVASVKLVATPLDRLHDAFEAEWRVEDCFGCKEKPRVIRLITSAIAQRSRKDLTNR